jgi:hypothetical protein
MTSIAKTYKSSNSFHQIFRTVLRIPLLVKNTNKGQKLLHAWYYSMVESRPLPVFLTGNAPPNE